jgi:hypothetical protein
MTVVLDQALLIEAGRIVSIIPVEEVEPAPRLMSAVASLHPA